MYNRQDRPSDFTHSKYIHKCKPELFEHLYSLYNDLSQIPDLLKLRFGLTTNCNEALNSKIWRRALKISFQGLVSVEIALFDAVICPNDGYSARLEILRDFCFSKGNHTEAGLLALDKSVISK